MVTKKKTTKKSPAPTNFLVGIIEGRLGSSKGSLEYVQKCTSKKALDNAIEDLMEGDLHNAAFIEVYEVKKVSKVTVDIKIE